MPNNNAISSSDPQAIEKLTDKLEECKSMQDIMKAVNIYWRKYGTLKGAPGIPFEQCMKIESRIANARSPYDQTPFRSYELSNNNAEIKRLEGRIAELTRNSEVGFAGWEFAGGTAEANKEMNRLQLFFDERPNAEQCAALKGRGFKWAPTQGAWQRQLNNNAIYAAGRLDFIKPSDGRSVREHQPKAPAKDTEAR